MRRLLILAALLSLHAVSTALAQTASTVTKTIAERVAGLRKLDGYMPLVLGRSQRPALSGDLAVRSGVSVSGVARGGPRIESRGPRSRAGGPFGSCPVRARRAQSVARPDELRVSRARRAGGRTARRRRFVRDLGTLGLHGGRGRRRTRARGRDLVLRARRARRRRSPASDEAGQLSPRGDEKRGAPSAHKGVSKEHRSRGDADLRHHRHSGTARARSHAGAAGDDRATNIIRSSSSRTTGTRRAASTPASASFR